MLPPMCVTQKARRPEVATWAMPKPPLGPSSQPRIVRLPNVQRPRVAVSQSRTCPQSRCDRPTAQTTERCVTESAVTGAAFVTVRPGVSRAVADAGTSSAASARAGMRRRIEQIIAGTRDGVMRSPFGDCAWRSARQAAGTLEFMPTASFGRFEKVLRIGEGRRLKRLAEQAAYITSLEPDFEELSDAELVAQDRGVQAADRERRVARRDPLRSVRRGPRGPQAGVGAAPVRRPADGRHRPPRGRHRRDEDR